MIRVISDTYIPGRGYQETPGEILFMFLESVRILQIRKKHDEERILNEQRLFSNPGDRPYRYPMNITSKLKNFGGPMNYIEFMVLIKQMI